MISAKVVRLIAIVVCAGGIVGMIVTSALNHNGAAITFGIVTAVAILCSMVGTAVAADAVAHGPGGPGRRHAPGDQPYPPEKLAEIVEQQIDTIVRSGADETTVRQLVGEAVRLGRALSHEAGVGS